MQTFNYADNEYSDQTVGAQADLNLRWPHMSEGTFLCCGSFISSVGSSTDCCKCSFRDCQDYLENGTTTSAIYKVTPVGMNSEIEVYCDMKTDGGGWVVSIFSL